MSISRAAVPLLALAALAACVSSLRTVSAGTTVYAMPGPMTCAVSQAEALGFRVTPGADSTRFTGTHPGGTRLEVRLDTLTRELKASAQQPVQGGEPEAVPLASRTVGEIGRLCGIVSASFPK